MNSLGYGNSQVDHCFTCLLLIDQFASGSHHPPLFISVRHDIIPGGGGEGYGTLKG